MWIIELQYSQQITNPKYVQTISTLSVGWLNVDWSVRACTCSQRKSFLAKTQLCMGISPLCFVLWFDMYISLFSCSHENVKYDLNWRKKITTCTKTFPFLEKNFQSSSVFVFWHSDNVYFLQPSCWEKKHLNATFGSLYEFHLTYGWKLCASAFIYRDLYSEEKKKKQQICENKPHPWPETSTTHLPNHRWPLTSPLTTRTAGLSNTQICVTAIELTAHVEYGWMWLCGQEWYSKNSDRETRKSERKRRRELGQRGRDGKQFQLGDWSLIKSNVTVLLDFPPATHCTLLPVDDKIITNSPTQHFPFTHTHTLSLSLSLSLFGSWIKTLALHLVLWN